MCIQEFKNSAYQQTLCFSISDSGPGVSEDMHAAIFEPFQQADGSITRIHGGTGLGLAISKKLIDLMEGAIHVKNASLGGACFQFTITLPVFTNFPELLSIEPAHIDSSDIFFYSDTQEPSNEYLEQLHAWSMKVSQIGSLGDFSIPESSGNKKSLVIVQVDYLSKSLLPIIHELSQDRKSVV